jgi:hypothetical protein
MMADGERPTGLELEQDLEFQRRDWRRERWGWAVMMSLVAAALLGLCGTGPLSDRIAGEKGGVLWAEYQLFGRWQAPEELRVHVGPGQTRDGRVHVWLSRELVEKHDIEHVTPPPEGVEIVGDRYIYVFRAPAPDDEIAVTFTIKPERWGIKRGTVGIAGGHAVTIWELVYP